MDRKKPHWIRSDQTSEVLLLLLTLGPGLGDGPLHLVVPLVIHLLHHLKDSILRRPLVQSSDSRSSDWR